MTVDLLPSPRSTGPAHRNAAADRVILSCVHLGTEEGWTQIEHSCPYCCGPETD